MGHDRYQRPDQGGVSTWHVSTPYTRTRARQMARSPLYFDVGMLKSAPEATDSGHRCMTDFCRV
jgi:hypothetical protein